MTYVATPLAPLFQMLPVLFLTLLDVAQVNRRPSVSDMVYVILLLWLWN